MREGGAERARFVLSALQDEARRHALAWQPQRQTPYVNTISLQDQAPFPGHLEIEQKLAAIMRWNALAMVVRANQRQGELGGHISSYASAADLFEVGFNHFFRARSRRAATAATWCSSSRTRRRASMRAPSSKGGSTEADLDHYRQEVAASAERLRGGGARGLCSYPHPWLMPDFWQFPTGSMGLGPLSAVYQARFMRYLEHRDLIAAGDRRIWGFFGDGEMDEPESLAGLSVAARENLDNLIFVVNCNLQRLDGPVRGNGRIIDELETVFAGAGWHVIKLRLGQRLGRRSSRATTRRRWPAPSRARWTASSRPSAANDGAYNRARFFGQSPELEALVNAMTDDEIDRLHRGGHDLVKIHAAYAAAVAHRGAPVVILAKTMKGYGMGASGQGRMTTHQQKKLEGRRPAGLRAPLPAADERRRCAGAALLPPRRRQPRDAPPAPASRRPGRLAAGAAAPTRPACRCRRSTPSAASRCRPTARR